MKLQSFCGIFKSLLGCKIDFSKNTPLTCLIGLNGAGKSNVLQGIGFLGACLRGDLDTYIEDRAWQFEQLPTRDFPINDFSKYFNSSGCIISFTVKCLSNTGDNLQWHYRFNTDRDIHPIETFSINDKEIFVLERKLIKYNDIETKVVFTYTGSILAKLDNEFLSLTPEILDFKRFISDIYTFDVLEPARLKESSKFGINIGSGGGTLAAYYDSLKDEYKEQILLQLQTIYPWIVKIDVVKSESGAKQIEFEENHYDQPRRVSALHSNDGTLRLLAILAELHSNDSVIIFDEIENGFNPAVSKQVMEILLDSPKQVIISTHSPDLLQYIPDKDAEDVVKLVYRTKQGTTECMNFFDLPEAKRRLGVLGVGEAFLDVDIADAVANWQENTAPKKGGQ